MPNKNLEDAPMDDRGIDNDMILDILEEVINKLHNKITSHEADKMSVSEIKDVAIAIDVVWHTVESVLNLDDFFRQDDDIKEENEDEED